jgi:hypothetical protein
MNTSKPAVTGQAGRTDLAMFYLGCLPVARSYGVTCFFPHR